MRNIIIIAVLALAGLGGGAVAGYVLRPLPDAAPDGAEAPPESEELPPEFVKLDNQFVVPVLEDGQVASMVILSLGLEVEQGATQTIYAHEPKLRDVFLQVLFSHANSGGFRGSFTDAANLIPLRIALNEAARGVLGNQVRDVLINDIARQDSRG